MAEILENDIPYEEEVIRYPYSLNCWKRYIEYKSSQRNCERDLYIIYERALTKLPSSYKLWNEYLKLRRTRQLQKCINDLGYEDVNVAHEKSLIFMNKMPRIWIEYLRFMFFQRIVNRTRLLFDRALRSLPITQHHRIWKVYILFNNHYKVPVVSKLIFNRYIKIFPEHIEDYITFLIENKEYNEAASQLVKVLNDTKFVSKYEKAKYDLLLQLCEIVTQNPYSIVDLSIPEVIKYTFDKYVDVGFGRLWCMLCDYYIKKKLYEKARSVFEEGIEKTKTVKDFGIVFDSYIQFEELYIAKFLERAQKKTLSLDDKLELDLRFERLECLIDNRPIYLSSVLLRQNPHNVDEWLKRVSLFQDISSPRDQIISTYEEAISKIDFKQALGKITQLWFSYASFFDDVSQSRLVYEKAVQSDFQYVDELAQIWLHYIEMEIKNNNISTAMELVQRATTPLPRKHHVSYYDKNETVHARVYKNIRLWLLYVDLTAHLGCFDRTKAVYEKMLAIKVVNGQTILNYARFLEENAFFEDSFRVYEKGVSLITWPYVSDIWNEYIIKFIKRYSYNKIERIRDLFEQVLKSAPDDHKKLFFIAYADVEEKYGSTKNTLAIYKRGVVELQNQEDKYSLFLVFINKTKDLMGLTFTRSVFEHALEILSKEFSLKLGIIYAEMEKKLGEIDRCRFILSFIAQFANPRVKKDFWLLWQEFETNHGNAETFREMLRIKRTILGQSNTRINLGMFVIPKKTSKGADNSKNESNPMELIEDMEKINFVKSKNDKKVGVNPDEIELDDILDIEEKEVPKEVFSGINV